ncbi:MAG: DNA polymerase sliding clamp [Candidatus Ratteibacteria bacterium]|nr:DNA polymerase sliding clamp [Candidatus Ratteibacteria bacterium]
MFKASIKGKRLKEAIIGLKTMVDEARFTFSPERITVRAVEPANVAMVSMSLSKEAFEEYSATDMLLAIDLTKQIGYLEMAEDEDIITLELDEKEHKLKMTFRGLTYTMSLIDPETIRKEPKIPALSLPVELMIGGADFKFGMKAVDKIAEYVSFEVDTTGTKFIFSAKGDTDDVIYEVPSDRLKIIQASKAKSLFAIEYLIKIQKLVEKKSDLTIILGRDYPVKIGFPISEGHGIIEFMIAPRVEEE